MSEVKLSASLPKGEVDGLDPSGPDSGDEDQPAVTLLTLAQRRAIDRDDIGWEGWDARGLPVLSDAGRRYAVDKDGAHVGATEPVQQEL